MNNLVDLERFECATPDHDVLQFTNEPRRPLFFPQEALAKINKASNEGQTVGL